MNTFLPISSSEMQQLGWKACDFIIITGDAYVDHPSFGVAVIGRLLESQGYRVGIIPQPDWTSLKDFQALGKPNLAFLITSGNMDSMVNKYSSTKKPRRKDLFSPNGEPGKRPDRAVIAYSSKAKQAYKGVPIILGGIEASLRRMAHYDYWSNSLRRSVLADAKADLLVYGMGETAVLEIAKRLEQEKSLSELQDIRGIVYRTKDLPESSRKVLLPSFAELQHDKRKYAESFIIQQKNTDALQGKILIEQTDSQYIVQNPPCLPLAGKALDRSAELPYQYSSHPVYKKLGPIPAIEEVKFSITSNRGCMGACSFCALTFHQGRTVTHRTEKSVINEATKLTRLPGFKGYIHDVGGPTANFQETSCPVQEKGGACRDRQCLYPDVCPKMKVSHKRYLSILRKIRNLPGIKKVFIRSGIRYDYLLADNDPGFLKELCEHHVSGQLKVAPEHVSAKVLNAMGKPGPKVYEEFKRRFEKENSRLGKKQYIIPYFISSHPGSTLKDAVELALYLKNMRFVPDQVQDFYPTPGTIATCMYYTGIDPRTGKEIYVPRDPQEKALQRALLHFNKPENHKMVIRALEQAGRSDLIGFEKRCLIKPHSRSNNFSENKPKRSRNSKGAYKRR